jgi:hypothetical protein
MSMTLDSSELETLERVLDFVLALKDDMPETEGEYYSNFVIHKHCWFILTITINAIR